MKQSEERLKQYFKSQKGRAHKIEGHPLAKTDEYIRDYYLTMLCVASQSEGELEEGQALFIQRIISGIENAKDMRAYIKKAFEIDNKFAEEFVRLFKDDNLKYNLLVDCLIIANLHNRGTENSEFIADMSDTLGISADEMLAIVEIVGGILNQDSEKYIRGTKSLSVKFDYSFFWHYGREFVAGCIQQDDQITYYYSLNKNKFEFSEQAMQFKSKKVIFENLIINLENTELKFSAGEEVQFINCEVLGKANRINIEAFNKVTLTNSLFRGFTNVAFHLNNVKNLEVFNSNFEDCITDQIAGVFDVDSTLKLNIENSEFKSCRGDCSSIVFFNKGVDKDSTVKDCKFYSCTNTGWDAGAFYNSASKMFENCESVGSQQLWIHN